MAEGDDPGVCGSIHNPEVKSHAWKPKVFAGDRKKLDTFLWDCGIYILSNIKDFLSDAAKTQFILFYINGGEADSWKEFYIESLKQVIPLTNGWKWKNLQPIYRWTLWRKIRLKNLLGNLR